MANLSRKVLQIVLSFLFIGKIAFAQSAADVQWKTSIKPGKDNTFQLRFEAKLPPKYHLYSHDIGPDIGPVPTTFTFEKNKDYSLSGNIKAEGIKITKFDETFGAELSWFENKVTFVQDIKLIGKTALVKGTYEFMVCDDKACFPPESIPFSFDLKAIAQNSDTTEINVAQSGEQIDTALLQNLPASASKISFSSANKNMDCHVEEEKGSLWLIFLLGFGGGLIALLTPCVFPLIPLTVGFFTKGGKDKKGGLIQAGLYGLSIILIYVSLGILVTLLFGADALNTLSTGAFFNLLFFSVFVIFAISFFGAFEITLPSSWANTTDKLSSKSGFVGIFFMAFTLALVSFSCTGPIIGSLLVEAATSSVGNSAIKIEPVVGMFGFSLALALPFSLFALFPQWLKSLPKSGGWMSAVKIILGFIELAFSLKFLSTADLTYNWGFLRWEIFVGLWFIIFLSMGIYGIGIGRKGYTANWLRIFGVGSLIFAGILAFNGLRYEPIPLLSGIAPPAHYNFFNPDIKAPYDFKDFDEALTYAKKKNLPILIDFTGDGCVNCRKMEESVWIKPEIRQLMKKYVVVSLYVDDREELPQDQHFVSDITGKQKLVNTVGEKWSDFEIRHFKKASQPYYVPINTDLEILTEPLGFVDKTQFEAFLRCGLDQHERLK